VNNIFFGTVTFEKVMNNCISVV